MPAVMPGVVAIEAARLHESAAVLADAFGDYAVFRYVLPPGTAAREQKLAAIMRFYLLKRLSRHWPVFGIEEHGVLQAVITANPPEHAPEPPELMEAWRSMKNIIGAEAEARRQAYEAQSDVGEPDVPHYFVGMVGVRAAARGRGHARALLQQVHALSRAHPDSQGVALATENAENLPLYQGMGYVVTGEADVGEIHSWAMWRPDDRG